jgi:predicted metal-dependent peptidase
MAFDPENIRAKIISRLIFLAEFVMDKENLEDNTIPTLTTNGVVIKYNPTFMNSRTVNDQFVLYLHEIVHNFLGHPLRMTALMQQQGDHYDEEAAQRAADYAVNDLIYDAKFTLPPDALYDHKYIGMAFEEIYPLLAKQKQRSHSMEKQWNPLEQGECKPQAKPGSDPHAKEEDQPELTPQEVKELLDKHQQKMTQAIQMGQMAGNIPAGLKRLFDKLTESKVDWRDVLPVEIGDVLGYDDYSYMHPDPRYSDEDFLYPGMVAEERGEVVIAVDTSCSVTNEQAADQASEALEIVKNHRPEKTYVLWVDTKVHNPQVFDKHEQDVQLEPKGGGGTDFRPPFRYVEENGIQPKLFIYMSDGWCHSFPPEPSYPVIWVIVGRNRGFKPPFGEVIYKD